ncbi:hypothetical protein BH24BAC1_BH24BAC1_03300 [soil metagenome]|jgi:uncharacterized surface protein with fasciclin (FAS1) repeats
MDPGRKAILLLSSFVLIAVSAKEGYGQQEKEALALSSPARNSILVNIALGNSSPLLVELLAQAGLGPLLSSEGPYTFFAPSEGACLKLRGQKPEVVRAVLSYHILEGKHTAADFRDGSRLRTIMGESISVLRKKEAVFINGSQITAEDHVARNGVRHTIDALLMPKNLQ